MKVSVVIPVFNEEKYLKNCLESICNQEITADEIIVVDNNSTDKSVEIAKEFPVRIVHEAEQGMIAARNRGFNEAKYEIIARTDADVTVPRTWIKTIKHMFDTQEIDAFSGPIVYDLPFQTSNSALLFLSTSKILFGHNILLGPNMILKKSAWNQVKDEVCLDDNEVHEDIDMSIHLDQHHLKIEVDPKFVVKSSSRRIREKPWSFFLEYPYRVMKTIRHHER
ncbi:MAG: glycosyltransferase family 2 protein [Weeksellaceae bacterium]